MIDNMTRRREAIERGRRALGLDVIMAQANADARNEAINMWLIRAAMLSFSLVCIVGTIKILLVR